MENNHNTSSDSQIKMKLAAKKQHKRQRRRVIAVFVAILLSVVDGFIIGRFIGTRSASQTKSIEVRQSETIPEYISTADDIPLINIAMQEISTDNNGGSKFWSWYGYGGHVPWCACYVSWCEDKAGYLSDGRAPKFAYVPNGSDWFKSRGQWLNAGDTPSAGDLIFFDWEQDGGQDHVGIVTAVRGDRVFAVEGNSSDRCRQKRYMLNDPVIYGYGHIK